MKLDELKLRIANAGKMMIDEFIPRDTFSDRFINTTLKIMLKSNLYRVNNFISMFKGENDDVDLEQVIEDFIQEFGDDSFKLNLRDYIQDETLREMIPNKTLLITKEDLFDLINGTINK